jgi:hypothetical protein
MSSYTDSTSNTNPISEGYYVMPSQDSYSTLVSQSIRKETINYFVLNTQYCIQQVYIPNPYKVNFWLELSGFTFPNFKYDETTGMSSFDVNDYKDIIPHTGDEVYLDNKNKFPRIQIMYPKTCPVVYNKNSIPIRIKGFEELEGGNVPIDVTLNKSIKSYKLTLNAPTDSIDFYGKLNTVNPTTTTGNVIISLNNKVYQTINIVQSSKDVMYRVKLDNSNGAFALGDENNYLPANINVDTINLSKVSNIDIEFNNFNDTQLIQNVYLAYNYPSRSRIFTYN